MTQEEDVMREALLALLCVGDTIRYIACNQYSSVGGIYHIGRLYRIQRINPGVSIRITSTLSEFSVDIENLHQYNGRLYICYGLKPWSEDYREVLDEIGRVVESQELQYTSEWEW
jgi:hypothetical protein